tara:strand:+ start:2732 stop:2926 length:195 start_codon:yes stop_codon:yes gene_type:complete
MEGFEYSTIILGVMFICSEVLPFIKKHKGNGLCESVICLLRGSSCLATKIADKIENKEQTESVV